MNARSNKVLGFIETTILQEDLVRITNRRMLVGTMTYWMYDIRSVSVTRQERTNRPVWLVIIGLFFLLWSVIDQTGYYVEFLILVPYWSSWVSCSSSWQNPPLPFK
jgi:hypothetical protein